MLERLKDPASCAPGSSPTCEGRLARLDDGAAGRLRRPGAAPLCRQAPAGDRGPARQGVEETAVDLVVEDGARSAPSSTPSPRRMCARCWRGPGSSFGSDAAAIATEPPFTDKEVHPRAYGNFARLLGRYVRDEKALSLAEAVRRLTSLPADNLRIADRGRLSRGFHADLAIFDPAKIADRATYEKPHQYAVGMRHVFVNGVQVLRDGEHTGAKPGRFVRGPGWRKCK